MVATILKKVTEKGIEAATQSISKPPGPGLGSGPLADNTNRNGIDTAIGDVNLNLRNNPNPTMEDATSPLLQSATDTTAAAGGATSGSLNDAKNPSSVHATDGNDNGYTYTYLNSFSSTISEYYSSAKNVVHNASDEASRQISSQLTSFKLPTFYSDSKSEQQQQLDTGNGTTPQLDISPQAGSNARVSSSPSSPMSGRKWFRSIKDPYNNVAGTRRHTLLNTNHEDSILALRNLLEVVDVDSHSHSYSHAYTDADANVDADVNADATNFLHARSPMGDFHAPDTGTNTGTGIGSTGKGPSSSSSEKVLIHSRYATSLSLSDEDETQSHGEMSGSDDQNFIPVAGYTNASSSSLGMGRPTAGSRRPHLHHQHQKHGNISNEVKASMLGDLTIRAMRDMALSEALQLHDALRFWTERFERPFLHYLEFGPQILWSRRSSSKDHRIHRNYDPSHDIGQNVSQLQAVLARRCSCIGELQQHLWRAGWQSGVGQWGIVGSGEWAAVVGGHGEIDDGNGNGNGSGNYGNENENRHSGERKNLFFSSIRENMSHRMGGGGDNQGKKRANYYAQSHLFVSNVRGGKIVTDDPALASWSIDAIRVVRDQLYSAGNTSKPLPYYENWPSEVRFFRKEDEVVSEQSSHMKKGLGDSMISVDDNKTAFFNDKSPLDLPLWATQDIGDNGVNMFNSDLKLRTSSNDSLGIIHTEQDTIIEEESGATSSTNGDILIGDISLMAAEVKTILKSMEKYMKLQRERRLNRLRPPSRLVRNWYIVALTTPVLGYMGYRLFQGKAYVPLANEVCRKIATFWGEHVSEPLHSIYRELFTKRGREDVTDRKARQDAISALQRMIKSWLEENYPEMPEAERNDRAAKMDLGLIEAAKEYSVKNILEINNIYRLSLIEMQFIKKEMMNALYAMDVLMGSNEINMQLAAMTPFFLLASTVRYIVHKIMYAILKMGKSKEETYASFRHILLDIERLLVMRDNPPPVPPPLSNSVNKFKSGDNVDVSSEIQHHKEQVLNPNDLGMLMLLVHECRVILWQDRRRFTRTELRNVSEDLAELAGERGAVSVQQQLRIIARMCRTYSFLKVISSGISFSTNAASTIW